MRVRLTAIPWQKVSRFSLFNLSVSWVDFARVLFWCFPFSALPPPPFLTPLFLFLFDSAPHGNEKGGLRP
jgi:hypothetical protein